MAYCHLKGCPIFENGGYSSSEIRNWNGMCCTLAHGWGTKFLQTTIILRAYLSHAFCLISQKILIHITQWFLLPAAASFACWKQWLKICSAICIFRIFSLHLFFNYISPKKLRTWSSSSSRSSSEASSDLLLNASVYLASPSKKLENGAEVRLESSQQLFTICRVAPKFSPENCWVWFYICYQIFIFLFCNSCISSKGWNDMYVFMALSHWIKLTMLQLSQFF